MILNFDDYITSLKEASYDKNNKEYMFCLLNPVINYDKFQEAFFALYNKPVACSMDALIKSDDWYFVEFKNGKIDRKQKSNISEKIGHSIITFLLNLDEKIDFCQHNVNFILVYNEENNNSRNNQLSKDEYQLSIEREKLKSHLPGVKRRIPLFQMGRYENMYFKKVYTYSKNEFEQFVKAKLIM